MPNRLAPLTFDAGFSSSNFGNGFPQNHNHFNSKSWTIIGKTEHRGIPPVLWPVWENKTDRNEARQTGKKEFRLEALKRNYQSQRWTVCALVTTVDFPLVCFLCLHCNHHWFVVPFRFFGASRHTFLRIPGWFCFSVIQSKSPCLHKSSEMWIGAVQISKLSSQCGTESGGWLRWAWRDSGGGEEGTREKLLCD